MVGLAILMMLAATALFAAAALRLGGLAVTLIAAYVVLVAETTALTLVLSPFRAVEQEPLVVAEAFALAIAIAVWWRSGRPGLGLRPAGVRLLEVVQDRLVAAFLLLFIAVIVVQLVGVWTAPANNWDSLTYHLPRAAA